MNDTYVCGMYQMEESFYWKKVVDITTWYGLQNTMLIVDLEADLQFANAWLYVSLCPVLLFFLLQLLPVFTFDLWHGWSCVTWGRQQVGRTQVAEVLGYLVHEVLKFPNIPCKILKSFIVLNIIFHNKKKTIGKC